MSSPALGSSPRLTRIASVLFVFLLIISSLPLLADSHARIVRLSFVDGEVELDKGDGRGFNVAYMNMPISHGWKLWARDGQAEAEFEDDSSIRLTPDTIVAFSDLSLDSNGGRNTSVELQQGTAYFDVRHRDQDTFHLLAGRDRIELLKSAHFRISQDQHQVELAVLGGEVQVSNGSGEVAVRKGETIRLDDDDPGRYYLAKSVDTEDYDKWDSERVKNHDEAVATGSVPGANSTLVYGLSDLSTYGDYFFVPGYGYMWRPASAPLGWDPFADGYWVSYPGSGYVFVSSYPWGWAPYRYGSWHFVNGRGWCWAPGSHWNSWHNVPPVHNRPPEFRRPDPPPHHGPPVIAVTGGTQTPVPPHRVVLDNDSLERRWPRSGKETDSNIQALRQAQSQANVPASGLASSTPAATNSVVSRRDLELNRSRQATWQTFPNVPSAPQQTAPAPSAPMRSAVHAGAPSMSPRMESPRAPAMHTESRPMGGSPSMAPARSSSPSIGGGSISRGASGSGGGGGHSGGNHR